MVILGLAMLNFLLVAATLLAVNAVYPRRKGEPLLIWRVLSLFLIACSLALMTLAIKSAF